MSKPFTQGRMIIAHLRKRPMTYLDMLFLGLSTCPWRRVMETLHPDETLIKGKDCEGRTTWRVRRMPRVC